MATAKKKTPKKPIRKSPAKTSAKKSKKTTIAKENSKKPLKTHKRNRYQKDEDMRLMIDCIISGSNKLAIYRQIRSQYSFNLSAQQLGNDFREAIRIIKDDIESRGQSHVTRSLSSVYKMLEILYASFEESKKPTIIQEQEVVNGVKKQKMRTINNPTGDMSIMAQVWDIEKHLLTMFAGMDIQMPLYPKLPEAKEDEQDPSPGIVVYIPDNGRDGYAN